MSILGYDCNGRPLRAGDRVVLVGAKAKPECNGCLYRVLGIWLGGLLPGYFAHYGEEIPVELDDGDVAAPSVLRRVDDNTDHQPADAEFTTWLRGLGVGVPV